MNNRIVMNTKLPEGITLSLLQRALEVTFDTQKAQLDGQVHVSFVTKAESRHINSSNTGNDYPTDVLSLSYPVEKHEKGLAAAEIIICTPIARLQAKQYNVSLQEEICLLFVHGLLHTLGNDHQTLQDQQKYQQAQNAIMKKLNLTARNMPW